MHTSARCGEDLGCKELMSDCFVEADRRVRSNI